MGFVHMEQCGEQRGLGRRCILELVEQHMGELTPVVGADRREPFDQLIGGDHEVAVFGHMPPAFLLVELTHEPEQHIAFHRHQVEVTRGQLGVGMYRFTDCVLVAGGLDVLSALLLRLFPGFEHILHRLWRGTPLPIRQRPGEQAGFIGLQEVEDLRAERRVPLRYPLDGIGHGEASIANHRIRDVVRQCAHGIHHRAERAHVHWQLHDLVDMPAHHRGDDLACTGDAQRLRLRVEPHQQSVLAHDRLEERIVGTHIGFHEGEPCRVGPSLPRTFTRIVEHRLRHSRKQLGGGLVRESETQNMLRRHAFVNQVDHAFGHGERLARAGTRHHNHVGVGIGIDDPLLFGAWNRLV